MEKIKFEKISKEKDNLVFSVSGIRNSIANSVRRGVFEIETLAIDSVEFYKNDSVLYDEMIAQRLGLIPLKADLKTLNRPEECSCKGKGCLKCAVNLKLKAKGPGIVYASDLKGNGFEVIYPEMPIVLLAEGQELEFVAEAKIGNSKEHSKFSPALIWFNSIPETEISKSCNACGECIKVCPKKAISMQGNKIIIDEKKCDICGACIEKCKKLKDAIKIVPSKENFIFYIESFGQMSPEEVFIKSLGKINDGLNELLKELKKQK